MANSTPWEITCGSGAAVPPLQKAASEVSTLSILPTFCLLVSEIGSLHVAHHSLPRGDVERADCK